MHCPPLYTFAPASLPPLLTCSLPTRRYGLSYNSFLIGTPVLATGSLSAVPANSTIEIDVPVTNNSTDIDGTTVVQLYFSQDVAPVIRYQQQLVRYAKVAVPAGTTVTVRMKVKVSDMAFFDGKEAKTLPGKPGWSLGPLPTSFTLMAGESAGEGGDLPSMRITVV